MSCMPEFLAARQYTSPVLRTVSLLGLACFALAAHGQTGRLRVELGTLQTRQAVDPKIANAAIAFHQRVARLTEKNRAKVKSNEMGFAYPVRIEVTRNGEPALTGGPTKRFGDITLQFETSGGASFTPAYRQLLEDTYATAKPTMDALFGRALLGGTVRVRNFDIEIPDRNAVAGGIYLPNNGSGQREIRFPVYSNREAAAVNFIHTLLLAYQGDTPYRYDAFQEGLVRAVVAQVVRTPAAVTGLVPDSIEQVLANTYEVGGFYDWYNQRALGGDLFIAPNLLNEPLPAGGSYGGLYLLRYRMAGAAWQKVLVEYPAFALELNARLAADPTLGASVPRLITAGQNILNTQRPTGPTLEGRTFADWFRRQAVLLTKDTAGPKLLVQPTPITSGLAGVDFGVFNIELTYFSKAINGNETLLTGTCFPIFWSTDFSTRFSPSVQDDRIDIAGAYGSVGPNFPNDLGGVPYRVNVDLPVGGEVARAFLPAGAIATGSVPTPNDFYGTVVGATAPAGGQLKVRLSLSGTVLAEPVVQNGAFGARLNNDAFLKSRALVASVISVSGSTETVLFSRAVNKGPGELALDLRVGAEANYSVSVPAGLAAVGVPLEPFAADLPTVFNEPASSLLAARYSSTRGGFDFYPDFANLGAGAAAFTRFDTARTISVDGTRAVVPTSVALRPGWNQITTPLSTEVNTGQVRVVAGAEFPQLWTDAVGVSVGAEIFEFNPGANDPTSGVPETGNFVAVTTFRPGKSVYVRCLSADGATLLFIPAPSTGSIPRPLGWQMTAKIQSGNGDRERAEAIFGTDPRATRSFDRKTDSGLPPSMGGLQATIVGDVVYHREFRPASSKDSYVVRFENLRPGQTYTVTLEQDGKYADTVNWFDPYRKRTTRLGRRAAFAFTAESKKQWFRVDVGGVQK